MVVQPPWPAQRLFGCGINARALPARARAHVLEGSGCKASLAQRELGVQCAGGRIITCDDGARSPATAREGEQGTVPDSDESIDSGGQYRIWNRAAVVPGSPKQSPRSGGGTRGREVPRIRRALSTVDGLEVADGVSPAAAWAVCTKTNIISITQPSQRTMAIASDREGWRERRVSIVLSSTIRCVAYTGYQVPHLA